jgi:hypothetical protein
METRPKNHTIKKSANFSREVLDQLLHRGIYSPDGEEFGLGDVDFKPQAFTKKG